MQMTSRYQITTYDWDSQVPYQETIESNLVARTINVHYPDGQMKIFQDTVHLSRKIKVKADGSKVYGDWSQNQWKSYDSPLKMLQPRRRMKPLIFLMFKSDKL